MRLTAPIVVAMVLAQAIPSLAQSLSSTSGLLGHWTGSKVHACDRSNDSLIIIETDSYSPHESSCQFEDVTQRDDRFSADLSCWTEGEQMQSTVAARLLDQDTALIGDEYANLSTTGTEYYRCTPTDASTTSEAPAKTERTVHPLVAEDARKAVREAYNAYQVVEYCEKAGYDNYGYADDLEFQGAIKRIEALTGQDLGSLERTWSEVRGLVTANIERETTSRMAGACSLIPDRVSRIIGIAEALENYKPEPARDVMPSTSRPF